MAYKLQLKRGASGSLPTGSAGEPLFTTDTNDLYIGTGSGNQRYQKYIASGTSSQFLKGDGSLDSNTYYLASNPSAYIALTALTASAPLSYNNTTGAFTISQASGSVNGFLSSTDWTTFNNKQNTITNPVTGTGTTNYLPKWTSGSAIGNSVIQESSSLIGVNVTPTRVLHLSSSGLNSAIRLDNTVSGRPFLLLYDDSQNLTFINSSDSGYTAFNSGTGASTTKMLLTNGGNLLLNSTTDNGNRLQVTGNGYFSGSVGIGTSSPAGKLTVADSVNNGTANVLYLSNTSQTGVTSAAINFINIDGAIKSSIIGAVYGNDYMTFNVGSNTERMRINASGNLGLGVTPSAWISIIKSIQIGALGGTVITGNTSAGGTSTFGQNLYYDDAFRYAANGTSSYYSQISGSHIWYQAPSGTAGNAITFTQAMTLTANGRLLLGTTTEGTYLLDVNGGGRFTANNVALTLVSASSTGYSSTTYGANGRTFVTGVGGSSAGVTETRNAYYIYDNDAGLVRMSIASTGAATFSSSVTATDFIGNLEASNIRINQTLSTSSSGASGNFLTINVNGTLYKLQLLNT